MNYFTSSIPLPLAEKLKEKGMKVEIVCDNTEEHSFPPEYHCETIFAECFDWLMSEKGFWFEPHKNAFGDGTWRCFVFGAEGVRLTIADLLTWYPTWHEAAEKAIEKALTLI